MGQYARNLSAATLGIDAFCVQVEVDLDAGLPAFSIVGLPDAAVKESRDRVKSALKNLDLGFPQQRITVNLAPADLRKEGAAFDLAIAVGILAASRQVDPGRAAGLVLMGELTLEGGLRPVRGVLPVARCAGSWPEAPVTLVLPAANAAEAALIMDQPILGFSTLAQVVAWLRGEAAPPAIPPLPRPAAADDGLDLSDVRGQFHAKRALEVAAAGGHNLLLLGPPGSGKTMLARRMPGLLPPLSHAEALEVAAIHSVAGGLVDLAGGPVARPFRAPHHGTSGAALVGGGPVPRPGEVSLAHHGVLFLDELPEFNRTALEALRQPLEEGRITVARAMHTVTYPAAFMLVAAMNPCPCGWLTDPDHECRCPPLMRARYLGRVSGPLLDRIDLHLEVPALRYQDLTASNPGDTSAAVRRRVEAARARQLARLAPAGLFRNAQMGSRHLGRFCALDAEGRRLLEQAMERAGLSARGHGRILKVARTIADLADAPDIGLPHLAEALSYRGLDRRLEAGRSGGRLSRVA